MKPFDEILEQAFRDACAQQAPAGRQATDKDNGQQLQQGTPYYARPRQEVFPRPGNAVIVYSDTQAAACAFRY